MTLYVFNCMELGSTFFFIKKAAMFFIQRKQVGPSKRNASWKKHSNGLILLNNTTKFLNLLLKFLLADSILILRWTYFGRTFVTYVARKSSREHLWTCNLSFFTLVQKSYALWHYFRKHEKNLYFLLWKMFPAYWGMWKMYSEGFARHFISVCPLSTTYMNGVFSFSCHYKFES